MQPITTQQALQVLLEGGIKISIDSGLNDLWINIVGWATTFIALYFTIRHERKENYESRRLEIMPAFTYNQVEKIPDNSRKAELYFTTQENIPLGQNQLIVTNIELKNVGMSQCPHLKLLLRTCYYNKANQMKSTYDEFFSIDKEDSVYIQLTIIANKNELKDKHFYYNEHINLAYTNILRDCYEHSIDIQISNDRKGTINKKVSFIGYANRRDMSIYLLATYYQNIRNGVITSYKKHKRNAKKEWNQEKLKKSMQSIKEKFKNLGKNPN